MCIPRWNDVETVMWCVCIEAFDILKTSNKSVWSNVFWYVKIYLFSKFIQYTINLDKTRMLKKLSSDKINVTKNALFFLSHAPIHHSFTFNSRFLYELKHKFIFLKLCMGFSIFDSFLFLLKFWFFFQQKSQPLWF